MPLQLLEATAADAVRMAQVERAAYAPKPDNKILFPGPFPEDVLERRAAELVEAQRSDPTLRWIKVVDTDIPGDDSLIAWAQWFIWDPQPEPKSPKMPGPWANLEACGAVFGGLAAIRKRIMGDKSYVFLQLLQTDPAHQRRGAGAMLAQWGLDEATKLGLPAYLNASPEGHSLYQKLGFVDVEELHVDMSKWGLNEPHRTYAMIREVPS